MLWLAWTLASCLTLADAAGELRPGWVDRYLAEPPTAWDGWRNTLQPQGPGSGGLAVAAGGLSDYTIVLPAEPKLTERRAADELQRWLGRLTGAELALVDDTAPPAAREICIGRTSRWAAVALPARERAGLPESGTPPPGGYAIAVDGERVHLLGDETSGALTAALAFLEEDLGVRWYEAAVRAGTWDQMTRELNRPRWDDSGVIPPGASDRPITVTPRTVAPVIPVRHLSWQQSYNPWAVRNRVNGGYAHQYGQHNYATGGLFVHTFHRLVPPQEHFEQHPEYFALVGGQRQWQNAQICLTNPQVAAIAAQTAAKALAAVPASQRATRRLVSVSAEDWLGDCTCAQCAALEAATGSYSGVLLTFVNRVAELLATDYPWATVTTLAYRQSKRPPTAPLAAHPQVAVRFCTDFGASFTWPYHSFFDEQVGDLAEQRRWFEDWRQRCGRMHLWIYPHQYRHYLAPMPSLHAVAENLRYFAEQGAESVYVQQSAGADLGREPMRYWIFAKLMWDPSRSVDDLMRDYIWGSYGPAAPAVYAYEQLLLHQHVRHTDFERPRNWIYAIDREPMYGHDFVPRAREVLAEALRLAPDETVRRRVETLLAGVVYVETVQQYHQMRDGAEAPDLERYHAVTAELAALCERLQIASVGYFDGTRTVASTADWLAELNRAAERRFDQRYLPAADWGAWTFRWDPEDQGVAQRWFAADVPGADWTPVTVPAFLAETPAGNAFGHGWYRTTFNLSPEFAGQSAELQFGGVDEQAWIYVNGELVGEHTLESEFMVGQEVTVADLWNRPFALTVPGELLRTGANHLAVRIHNSAYNAGIHQPVRAYLLERAYRDACDGSALTEDFSQVASGALPAGWRRYIQESEGQVHGRAEVSRRFARHPSLHLQDRRSHVAVWTESDEVLPAGGRWAVQFDLRLTGGLSYQANDCGAILGLKRGERRTGEFLPVIQLDNGETPGALVRLLGLGQVLAADLAADRWHRLVVERDGATWRFHLNDELVQTVERAAPDLRGVAIGSFLDWRHLAQDVHLAGLKIGRFIAPER